MNKIKSQNYVKCSKEVLKMLLKVCGKSIRIPGLNDGRVKNRGNNCVFSRVQIVIFGQFYARNFHKKAIKLCKNCFPL